MKKLLYLIAMMFFGLTVNSQTVGDYNLLIVDGTFATDAQTELSAMGHTVTIDQPANMTTGYDYSPYDAIIFMYNSGAPSGMNEIIALNENCELGIILMRGENAISPTNMGSAVYWSDTDFSIDDNTHYITQPFSTGLLDLGFTYKSDLTPAAGTTVLGSVSGGGGSLVVHDTYKRVMSPYYGHTSGMPWTTDAEILMDRIIAWAVAPCCTPNTGTDVQTACDSYTWIDGNTYTSSNNTATHTLTNVAGCDSVVTLDLTITNSSTGTDVQTACDSYTWIDGNSYTADNNTATYTLTNAAGCDSVVTLDLTITNSSTGTDVQTACDSYTWIDGNTYTADNNTATYTLTNAAGCDSVVTLDLTINSVSNVSTTQNGVTITAVNANATYQWLDCDNNYAVISGETGQSFTADTNGNYAVELSENGCVDTSDCVSITTVGISEHSLSEEVKLYPNPTNGSFNVAFTSTQEVIKISVLDAMGRLVSQNTFNHVNQIQYEIGRPLGVYLVEISNSKGQRSIIRLVKK